MVKPAAARTAKVPSSTTGMARVGTSVARRFCRNRYITRKTSTIASMRVFTTDSIEALTTGELSRGKTARTPGGKKGSNSATVARTAATDSTTLAPVARRSARPAAGCPL